MQELYLKQKESLESQELKNRLLILSNHLFDLYQDLKVADVKWNGIDKPILNHLDNYNELEDVYGFDKDNSFVYLILNSAHDMLALSQKLNKLEQGYTLKE